jgi:hypothetical protein
MHAHGRGGKLGAKKDDIKSLGASSSIFSLSYCQFFSKFEKLKLTGPDGDPDPEITRNIGNQDKYFSISSLLITLCTLAEQSLFHS